MPDGQSEARQSASPRRTLLIATYVAASVLGYVLGARDWPPWNALAQTSTPLARLGFALREEHLQASGDTAAALAADVDSVRLPLQGEQLDLFDLVVAVRGLHAGGNSDWANAEALCRKLQWRRCDRPALEKLKERSRP